MVGREFEVKTSKMYAAMRQTKAAIAHLHKGELESAITLAAAAEGQVAEPSKEYLFQVLRKVFTSDDLNRVVHWLKHASGPETATISEFETALIIGRAIQKFVAAYKTSCAEFDEFSKWAVEKGHFPRPITEKASS